MKCAGNRLHPVIPLLEQQPASPGIAVVDCSTACEALEDDAQVPTAESGRVIS